MPAAIFNIRDEYTKVKSYVDQNVINQCNADGKTSGGSLSAAAKKEALKNPVPMQGFRRVGEPVPLELENKQLEPSMGIDDIAPIQKMLTETDFYVNLLKVDKEMEEEEKDE